MYRKLLLCLPIAAIAHEVPVFIADQNAFSCSKVLWTQLDRAPGVVWLDLFANFARQECFDNFRFNTEGIALGLNWTCNEWWTAGIAAFYTRDHFHRRSHCGGRIVGIGIGPFACAYICNFFIETDLLYFYTRVRHKDKYSYPINQLMPHLGLGYDFCWGSFALEPYARLDWVVNWREHSHTNSMLRSEVGLSASRCLDYCWGSIVLRGSGAYLNKAPFEWDFFRTQNLGTWTVSALFQNRCGYFALLGYDGEAGDGYLSNEIQLKLGVEF